MDELYGVTLRLDNNRVFYCVGDRATIGMWLSGLLVNNPTARYVAHQIEISQYRDGAK